MELPEPEDDFRVYGEVLYDSDCTGAHRGLLEDAIEWGRIVSRSPAFRGCVADQMTSSYIACGNEPYANASLTTQIDRALAVTTTPNDISIECSGGSGNASASGVSYGHAGAEMFKWSGWIDAAVAGLSYPLCGPGEAPDWTPDSCRYEGWPWSQVAGITWHETSHTHDYTHGDENGGCNASNPAYDFQVDSIPYIIGTCMGDTITASAAACGEDTMCGPHGRPVLEDGTCVCRRDPAAPYRESFGAPVRGDYNNDGVDDIAYYGLCGTGIECWRGHLGSSSGFTVANLGDGMWFAESKPYNRPVGGDFDNDGHEDDLMYYGRCGAGNACWRGHFSDGTSLSTITNFGNGAWFAAADARSTPIAGDFDNDGFVDDLAYYGRCGADSHPCWRVHRSTGSTFATPADFGGGMDFGGTDENRRPVAGDFDADGFRDDIAYYGDCDGSGCWRVHLGDGASFSVANFGVSVAWFAGDDAIHAPVAGDFDDDGAMDDLAYYGICSFGLGCWRVRRGNGTPTGPAGNSFSSTAAGGGTWFAGFTTSHAPVSGNFSGAGGLSGQLVYWGRCGSGDDCWRYHDISTSGVSTANFGDEMWFAAN